MSVDRLSLYQHHTANDHFSSRRSIQYHPRTLSYHLHMGWAGPGLCRFVKDADLRHLNNMIPHIFVINIIHHVDRMAVVSSSYYLHPFFFHITSFFFYSVFGVFQCSVMYISNVQMEWSEYCSRLFRVNYIGWFICSAAAAATHIQYMCKCGVSALHRRTHIMMNDIGSCRNFSPILFHLK